MNEEKLREMITERLSTNWGDAETAKKVRDLTDKLNDFWMNNRSQELTELKRWIVERLRGKKKSERPLKDEGEDILYDYSFCKDLGFNKALSEIESLIDGMI